MEGGRTRTTVDESHGFVGLLGPHTSRRLFVIGVWTFLGLVFSSARYVDDLSLGRAISVPEALAYGLVTWYTFGLLAIPLLWFVGKVPLSRATVPFRLPLYVLASLAFSILHTVITHVLWFERAGIPYLFKSTFKYDLVSHYHLNALIFAGIVGFHYASREYIRVREREVERARLETLLVQSQLDALRAQLQPHFLFNSLNSVAALIHEDSDIAYDMLTGVADLLRLVLEGARHQEVTLDEEITFIRRYAAVQLARFPGRLTLELDVGDDTRGALVPSLILQPLVENAILHGVAPFEEGGRVRVSSSLRNGSLSLRVSDSGPGIPMIENFKEGIGLSNCRERLRHLYGDNQRFDLFNAEGGGLVVQLEIPYRTTTTGDTRNDA